MSRASLISVLTLLKKRPELLQKVVPAAGTIALLVGSTDAVYNQAETRQMQSAARTLLGLRLPVLGQA
jgi:hypothetical protein